MTTVAIVPAAGSGKRLRSKNKKPFILLKGRPLIAYALEALDSSRSIDSIIIASEAGSIGRLKGIIKKYGFKKVVRIVKGGTTRFGSVRNCFNAIASPCDIVLIHDGARPFPEERIIRDSIALAKKFGACVTALRSTDTIKLVGKKNFIEKTLDRKKLWKAQTPQAFRYGLFKKALIGIKDVERLTDDACIFERAGKKVKILECSARNIKITTKEDIIFAEALLCA